MFEKYRFFTIFYNTERWSNSNFFFLHSILEVDKTLAIVKTLSIKNKH